VSGKLVFQLNVYGFCDFRRDFGHGDHFQFLVNWYSLP